MTTNPNEIIGVEREVLEFFIKKIYASLETAPYLAEALKCLDPNPPGYSWQLMPDEATQKVLVDKDDLQQACGLLRHLANIPGNSPKFSLIESLEKASNRANTEELQQLGGENE